MNAGRTCRLTLDSTYLSIPFQISRKTDEEASLSEESEKAENEFQATLGMIANWNTKARQLLTDSDSMPSTLEEKMSEVEKLLAETERVRLMMVILARLDLGKDR